MTTSNAKPEPISAVEWANKHMPTQNDREPEVAKFLAIYRGCVEERKDVHITNINRQLMEVAGKPQADGLVGNFAQMSFTFDIERNVDQMMAVAIDRLGNDFLLLVEGNTALRDDCIEIYAASLDDLTAEYGEAGWTIDHKTTYDPIIVTADFSINAAD